ncbi:hypothetical protein NBRC110019_05330 [Neptunitalea chrysea]|uniref:T9SS type A sorting domain-containing protein n=1 Tax=Neptunitalea chrysea TaxID=1647581 RepID=A0A9W6B555_9FLAO|nr:T9SS type A sorting domain-containing protein [Neptunitalea chrysea]GLB51494.1 hypothetical protein NBRC110019_05330 [Neptunitalea chrysea]
MTKTTSESLTKKMLRYGALTTVIGGAAEANGQIVYTDINPDEGGAGLYYMLDIDNDGSTEFYIENSSTILYGIIPVNYLVGSVYNDVSILGDTYYISTASTSAGYPFALNQGAIISAGNSNWNDKYQMFNLNSCGGSVLGVGGNADEWCGVTDKYIGLKFKIGSDTHYGWARMDVTNPSSWLIKDYAYNATPGASLEAGQTVLGVQENFVSTVTIVGLNKTIALYNLPEETSYNVISVTGQSVLKGTIKGETYVIDNLSLNTGVYIVELIDVSTGASTRKKVII